MKRLLKNLICPNCGLIAPRDVVSANIVQLIAFGTTEIQFDKSKILKVIVTGKEAIKEAIKEIKEIKAKAKRKKRKKTETGLAIRSGNTQR